MTDDRLFEKNKVTNSKWLETTIEYRRLRKTDRFSQWRYNQFLRQGGSCYYCDEPIFGVRSNVEHITPRSRGGTNKWGNLVLACSRCNKDKGTRILTGKEKRELRHKNKQKRGTYLKFRAEYQTETDVANWMATWL